MRNIVSVEDALNYVTDCTLATVCSMALKKSAPKGEFERQLSIAQTCVDAIKGFKVNCDGTRARDVIDGYKSSVRSWADSFKP